jgi:hypothetical protein
VVVDSGVGVEDESKADDDNDIFDFGRLPLLFVIDSVDVLSGRSREVGLSVGDDTDEDDDDSSDDF